MDVPRTYNVAQLKRQLMEYAQRIVAMACPKQIADTQVVPRNVVFNSKIRDLSGKFPIPPDFDYKKLLAYELESDYNTQL